MPKRSKRGPHVGRRKGPDDRNNIKRRLPDLFNGTDDPLTIRERLFVLHYNANGGNAAQAAKDAGYSASANGSKRRGYELRHRPLVQEALREVQAQVTAELGDVAKTIRVRMLDVMLSDETDRVSAGRLLAECTPGALVPKESKVNVTGQTLEQMVLEAERIRRERAGLPVEVQEQQEQPAPTVEAEGIDK